MPQDHSRRRRLSFHLLTDTIAPRSLLFRPHPAAHHPSAACSAAINQRSIHHTPIDQHPAPAPPSSITRLLFTGSFCSSLGHAFLYIHYIRFALSCGSFSCTSSAPSSFSWPVHLSAFSFYWFLFAALLHLSLLSLCSHRRLQEYTYNFTSSLSHLLSFSPPTPSHLRCSSLQFSSFIALSLSSSGICLDPLTSSLSFYC